MMSIRPTKRAVKKLLSRFTPRKFGNKPRNLSIREPLSVRAPERITFGDDVHIGPYSILKVITKTGSLMKHPLNIHVEQAFDPKITIGSRVSATGSLHLAAHDHIAIEDDVMIASNVFISDAQHCFEHANVPYKYQGMFRISPVFIKRGSWIGQNVVIMPGVTIGELSIVGANSVVTRSIPPRCIAVGQPARVIKRWDEGTQRWLAVRNPVNSPSPGDAPHAGAPATEGRPSRQSSEVGG